MNNVNIDDGGYSFSFKCLQAQLMPTVSGLKLEVAKFRDHIKSYDNFILNAHAKLNSQEKKIAYLEDKVKELRNRIYKMDKAINELQIDHLQNYRSFCYVGEAGYKRCEKKIFEDLKLYALHKCHLHCITEMMREHHWWDDSTFGFNVYAIQQLLDNHDIADEEWLQSHDLIVKNIKKCKEAYKKKGVNIPQKIHEIAKKVRLGITATNKKEREAGHIMLHAM